VCLHTLRTLLTGFRSHFPTQLMFYSCLTALGVWATHSQPWLWDTQQLWSGWPNQVMT